jgi:hypothetical protein
MRCRYLNVLPFVAATSCAIKNSFFNGNASISDSG